MKQKLKNHNRPWKCLSILLLMFLWSPLQAHELIHMTAGLGFPVFDSNHMTGLPALSVTIRYQPQSKKNRQLPEFVENIQFGFSASIQQRRYIDANESFNAASFQLLFGFGSSGKMTGWTTGGASLLFGIGPMTIHADEGSTAVSDANALAYSIRAECTGGLFLECGLFLEFSNVVNPPVEKNFGQLLLGYTMKISTYK